MKNLLLIILLVLAGISTFKAQESITSEQREFEEMARTFQDNYNAGSEKCDEILEAYHRDARLTETAFSGPLKSFTYEQLLQFCPHLPKKEVIETTTEQKLLTSKLGYDYVSQLYIRKSIGDTVRETSSKIWEKRNGKWKIIHVNSLLNKVCK
ncbi:hypothetical protein [Gramella sp. KN1008]|uniref:hypothetical protein n=1 Tax=Gramella sp. KN1008 TaxID=2529298 RepID=UPI001039AD40|nr:hypothetical protein [Gramella sp. KN1008]TBW29980.1 hypothetical protein EZJ28_00825 [Gramella sp. KN1008]